MISLPINRRFLELSWVVILGAVLLVKAQAAPIMTASEQSSSKLGGRELAFEPANEQGSGPTRFLARGRNYQFLLSANEVRFALFRIETKAVDSPASRHVQLTGHATQGIEARIEFLNANPRARVNGERELQGKVNYIIGNDPARWRTSVPTFETVRVEELYPGIGLVYYGNQQQLEYDFEIAPRADPSAIAMRFIGVDTIEVNGEGDLVLKISGVEIRQPRPRIYQMQGARRVDVKGGYQRGPDGIVQFELGTYDRERPLSALKQRVKPLQP